MRFTKSFITTQKEAKQYETVNATLLLKAGFIYQVMAGAYSFLPLGFRVLTKIENIVRREMDGLGSEFLLPALVPEELWTQNLNIVCRHMPHETSN